MEQPSGTIAAVAARASERVSVRPPSCLIKSWASSAPTEHVPGWGVLSGWPNLTPCPEKRSSALARVYSFPYWPENPTGWAGTWSGDSSATALTWFHEWAGWVLLGTHCCLLVREEEGSDSVMSSSWDPETEKPLLFWCFGYRWLPGQRRAEQNKTKQNNNNKILHPALPQERERWLAISDEQSPRSLGRPSQGLLHLRIPRIPPGAYRLYDAACWTAAMAAWERGQL